MQGHVHVVNGADAADPVAVASLVRVVLAEGHQRMRRSLRALLDAEPRIRVVAEAGDRATAIQHVHDYCPAVLVLDLGLADGSGLDLIRRLREQAPGTEIVVITMHAIPAFAHHALDADAAGFVLKDSSDTELLEAVRAAARGERYVSPRVMTALASSA